MGSSGALTSLDGKAWSEVSPPVRTGSWLMAVAGGSATFAAVGLHGTIFTLNGGSEWSSQASGVTTALYDVTFGPVDL